MYSIVTDVLTITGQEQISLEVVPLFMGVFIILDLLLVMLLHQQLLLQELQVFHLISAPAFGSALAGTTGLSSTPAVPSISSAVQSTIPSLLHKNDMQEGIALTSADTYRENTMGTANSLAQDLQNVEKQLEDILKETKTF